MDLLKSKKKMKKARIIKIELNNLSMGVYYLETDIIIINKHLDKFPKLRKVVIEHELKHYQEKTIYKAITRDFKDAYKIFSMPEFFEFKYFIENETPSKKEFYQTILYNLLVYPMLFFVQMYCEMRFMFINIKKLKFKNGKNKN